MIKYFPVTINYHFGSKCPSLIATPTFLKKQTPEVFEQIRGVME